MIDVINPGINVIHFVIIQNMISQYFVIKTKLFIYLMMGLAFTIASIGKKLPKKEECYNFSNKQVLNTRFQLNEMLN